MATMSICFTFGNFVTHLCILKQLTSVVVGMLEHNINCCHQLVTDTAAKGLKVKCILIVKDQVVNLKALKNYMV